MCTEFHTVMKHRNVLHCTSLISSLVKTLETKYICIKNHHYRLFCTMDKVHEVSKAGFKQGQHYDRYRPSYTDEVTSYVFKNLYRAHDQDIKYNVLELGAGTGKFTRKLKPLFGKDVRYLASDPSQEFLSVLQQQSPDVETKIFSAFSIPLPDNSVENMVCAQSFHWCANKECLDEMTRVLVPKGRILCVWNNKDWDIDWVKELENVLTMYYKMETPRAFLKQWLYFVEGYSHLKRVEHSRLSGIPDMKGNKDFILDHFTSISVISLLNAKEQEEARSNFKSVLDQHFPSDHEIHLPFFSEFYCTEKV